jgi:hypothetical protein
MTTIHLFARVGRWRIGIFALGLHWSGFRVPLLTLATGALVASILPANPDGFASSQRRIRASPQSCYAPD